jgi:pectinesterase
MKHLTSLILILFIANTLLSAKTYDIIVAKDGTGDCTTIGTAIDRLSATRRVIFVKNGVYNEKTVVPSTFKNVCLIGESVDGVIIKYNDYSGKSSSSSSTAESYTFKVEGDGFYAENITFQNTATAAQAVAIYTKADTVAFKNCKFLGYQDTHYADDGRQYFLNCTIKGDVDFIFGNAAAIFENCTIISSNRKGGYVTAPSTAIYTSGSIRHGFLFRNCEIIPEEGLADNSCYLGRPWGDNASSVFFNCKIGSHIKATGWSVWTTDETNDDHDNHETATFAEFNSMDMSGNLLTISGRADWSQQLTSTDTADYSIPSFFDGWTPYKSTPPASPDDVTLKDNILQWSAVENTRGYIIFRNDSAVIFTSNTKYTIDNNTSSNSYAIKAVGSFGALSEIAHVATSINNKGAMNNNIKLSLQNNLLTVPENQYVRIFNVSGSEALMSRNKKIINVSSLSEGVYILELYDNSGQYLVKKFILNRSY